MRMPFHCDGGAFIYIYIYLQIWPDLEIDLWVMPSLLLPHMEEVALFSTFMVLGLLFSTSSILFRGFARTLECV